MWKRLLFWSLTLAPLCSSCATPGEEARQAPLSEPFRVLLLGDSISIGYTPFVREALGTRAHVVRPMRGAGNRSPENCAGTNKGVEHLDRWLAIEGGDWDVIHFNFGLHDLKRVHPETGRNSTDSDHPHQATSERYEAQLRDIVSRLRETGARLVFCTTTPVPDGDLRPYREPADVLEYNRIATRVMEQEDVAVNDLFQFALAQLESIQRPADVHFTKEGSRVLGERVAEAILEVAGVAEWSTLQPSEAP